MEINCLGDPADLVHFDHQLWRIGRNHYDIGMSLNENARFFFVGLAQTFAGLNGFGAARLQRVGLGNALAISANTAEIRQATSRGLKTIYSLGDPLRQRV